MERHDSFNSSSLQNHAIAGAATPRKWEMSSLLPEHKLLASVAAQLMNGAQVALDDQTMRVIRLGSGRLRSVRFLMNGRAIVAIEQNRKKPSHWGELAKKGHQVVQFQDLVTKKYLAVVVDGEVTEYGKS